MEPEKNTPKPMTKLYIPVAGTWSRRSDDPGAWYKSGSAFDGTLAGLGYQRVPELPDSTGFWSGDLNGLFIQKFFGKSKDDWKDGGRALANFIRRRHAGLLEAADDVVLIAHSHGGQVVAFALRQLYRENHHHMLYNLRVVTVDMPVRSGRFLGIIRRGMTKVYKTALRAVAGRWTHLYDGLWDRTRVMGSHAGPRELKGACQNIEIPGGHSAVLRDPGLMPGWRNYLKRCP